MTMQIEGAALASGEIVPPAASIRSGRSRKLLLWGLAGFVLLLALAALWRFSPLHDFADTQAIASWLHGLRRSPWAPLIVIAVYVGANALFFPNTVLNAATILGMGTAWGLPCALAGSLTAAMLAYAAGRRYGKERLKNLDSKTVDRISSMLRQGGVLSVATLRLIPIAPYTVVNLLAGAARVRPFAFAFGTLLGLLPGSLLVTAFGHQLRAVLRHPSPGQIAAMVAVLVVAAAGAWWARGRALAA